MSQPAALPLGDRLMAALRAILQAEDPQRIYRGCWEYFVQSSNGTNCDMAPTDTTVPLPPLRNIPMRAGLPGCVGTPTNGTKCYVMFANADPGKPVIIAYDTPKAQQVNLNGSSPAAARVGDSVNCGYLVLAVSGDIAPPAYPGTAAGLAAATAAASAISGTVLTLGPGAITSGSGTVNIGG